MKFINNKIELEYGITTEKINKYSKKIIQIVKDYNTDNDMVLLRHRLETFTSRTVYMSKKFNIPIWKAKGFTSNYNELKFLLKQNLVEQNTLTFLKKAVFNAFTLCNVPLPYFLKGNNENKGFCLYNNLSTNKTFLLVDKIGIGFDTLKNLCNELGIDTSMKQEYNSLVRSYLIKVKVGY